MKAYLKNYGWLFYLNNSFLNILPFLVINPVWTTRANIYPLFSRIVDPSNIQFYTETFLIYLYFNDALAIGIFYPVIFT